MNHIQLRVKIGTIAVTWNSHGQLKRIDWLISSPPSGHSTDSSLGVSVPPSGLQEPALLHGLKPVPAEKRMPLAAFRPVLPDLVARLSNYFDHGEPIGDFSWNAIDNFGWTEFQKQVFRALLEIPHGETRTYAWVSRKITGSMGGSAAARAVGQALRRNPLPIIIPCHRITSADALGGFMGATDPDLPEVRLKRWLIELENGYCNPSFSFVKPGFELMAAEFC